MTKPADYDTLNFVLTNYIPRRLASRWVGRISHSENRVLRTTSLWLWRRFTDIDLSDAAQADFRSMHALFTRRLQPGARPIDQDPGAITSPCDAIIGAYGTVTGGKAFQVKGMAYALADLLDDDAHAKALEGGSFVTLRLTSAMYHRFHAPMACRATQVRHIFGDRWNVNPPTLRRVARLFCRNERVVVRTESEQGSQHLTLVAVAAILVSAIRLGFLELGPMKRGSVRKVYDCDAMFTKGEEMGWFEHGSTIIVFAPGEASLAEELQEGDRIRMGQPLMRYAAP